MNTDPSTARRARLSTRDRYILEDVARYRLTTNEVLHTRFFRGQQSNAVTKVTARLCRLDYLRQFPLYHPRTYFTLGAHGAALLGLPENRAVPLGSQSLPTEYAVLAFATLGRTHHVRLTQNELAARYPDLKPGLLEQPHCLDETGTTLELVRVDLGGRPDHVARKCAADIRARATVEPFVRLLRGQQFRLVVVTCTCEKAAAIRGALNSRVWPDGLLIHLAVVPELVHLTRSLHHAP